MAMTSWKVPDIADAEVAGLVIELRIDHSDPAFAADHIGPLRGIGMPMQFAHCAWRERHEHPGKSGRNRELGDICLTRPAARPRLADWGASQVEREAVRMSWRWRLCASW